MGQDFRPGKQQPMDSSELLRIVDSIHRDKNIDKEIVFEGIEAARFPLPRSTTAKRKTSRSRSIVAPARSRARTTAPPWHRGDGRADRRPDRQAGDDPEDPRGRARPPLQRIRRTKGQLVTGTIQRYEGGAATVSLQNVEAILPRGEQIPGESHHANERSAPRSTRSARWAAA